MDIEQPATQPIADLRDGDAEAMSRLLPLVYQELRRIAHRELRRQGTGHTLCTTALVHEAYLKLVNQASIQHVDRAHFLGVAACAMRQVLIDYARKQHTTKRGGEWRRVPLDEANLAVQEQVDTLLAVDQALTRLAVLNARLSRVVECRFFGGLTEEETAEVLALTPRTVRRDWVKAKAWLYSELYGDAA